MRRIERLERGAIDEVERYAELAGSAAKSRILHSKPLSGVEGEAAEGR
jgi:hypothetical protein